VLKRLAAVAALLLAVSVSSSAHAANIWTMPRRLGGSYIFIKGEIATGDDQTFAALNPPPPVFVRPSGPGGLVPPAASSSDQI